MPIESFAERWTCLCCAAGHSEANTAALDWDGKESIPVYKITILT